MTKPKNPDQYVLIDGTGAEKARGTAVDIGDAILSYDGRSWDAARDPNDPSRWIAYRYVGSKIDHLPWLSVEARNEGEALDKLALAAFEASGNGKDRHLSIMTAADYDAVEDGENS